MLLCFIEPVAATADDHHFHAWHIAQHPYVLRAPVAVADHADPDAPILSQRVSRITFSVSHRGGPFAPGELACGGRCVTRQLVPARSASGGDDVFGRPVAHVRAARRVRRAGSLTIMAIATDLPRSAGTPRPSLRCRAKRPARMPGLETRNLTLVSDQHIAASMTRGPPPMCDALGLTPLRKRRRRARRLRVHRPAVRAVRARMKPIALLLSIAVFTAACSSDAEGPPVPDPQRGFALPAYAEDGYTSDQIPHYLREMSGLGAEWVQINPTWYQPDAQASEIVRTEQTASDDSVERVISLAKEAGLKVLLKPHVDLIDGRSRHEIMPDDRLAWFASYAAYIEHYADVAARLRVDQFAVGTELSGVSGDRQAWLGIVNAVRARYAGPVLYAANFDEYRAVSFWYAVDLIGIDAYWELADQPTSDVAELQEAWQPIRAELREFAAQTGRRILFSEAGYTSQLGTTTAPFAPMVSGIPDQAEQAAAYQALFESFQGEPWWAGVFWWYWAVPLDERANGPLSYSPDGKAAEEVVRRWWSSKGRAPRTPRGAPAVPTGRSTPRPGRRRSRGRAFGQT